MVSDEVLDDDELLESDEVFDDDELLEEEVLLVVSELLELPLVLDNRSSTIVKPPEPLELLDGPAVLEPSGPPPGGAPPAPPGPFANALVKRFCARSLDCWSASRLILLDLMLPGEDGLSLCAGGCGRADELDFVVVGR